MVSTLSYLKELLFQQNMLYVANFWNFFFYEMDICDAHKLDILVFGIKCFGINPRSLEGGGGGGQIDPPLDFFGFKFLLLDRLSKALAQLFLVCEHIF